MKFQDSSFNGLKVTVGTKSVTHARTHAPTHARSKSNMPHQLFQSWGHNYCYFVYRRISSKETHFLLQYEIFHRFVIHLWFYLFEDVTDCRGLR